MKRVAECILKNSETNRVLHQFNFIIPDIMHNFIVWEKYFIYHEERYFSNEYEWDDQNVTIRYDRADLTRNKYGVNLKFGVMVPFGDRMGINTYIGAGPRIRNVKFNNLVNPRVLDYYDDYHDEWWSNNYQKEGLNFGFNFALGIKFLYRITNINSSNRILN